MFCMKKTSHLNKRINELLSENKEFSKLNEEHIQTI